MGLQSDNAYIILLYPVIPISISKPFLFLRCLVAHHHFPSTSSRLQVLRYKQGQYYEAHRDFWDPAEFPYEDRFLHPVSQTWLMRHATLLWYLQRPERGWGVLGEEEIFFGSVAAEDW